MKKPIKKKKTSKAKLPAKSVENSLIDDIKSLIDSGREKIAQVINSGLVLLYWSIGDRIYKEILNESRAEYGEEIVQTLSEQLSLLYGRGYSRTNLFAMVRMAEVFPEIQIVQTLSGQLGWSHFLEIIYLPQAIQRNFYAEMCRIERWSVRELRKKINGMLFERTAIAKKPKKLVQLELEKLRDEDRLTPDLAFHDPYFLEFLNLRDPYSEKDLEAAILRELESFILELGNGFTFMGRQKRITIDNQDYYIDLLFFNRKLRRLVAIELKLEKFKAADKGQMELYLRWLEKYEKQKGEESPIGLILCANKSDEHVELLQLEKSGIRVATYLTELPPRELLEKKLHDAITQSKERLARRKSRN